MNSGVPYNRRWPRWWLGTSGSKGFPFEGALGALSPGPGFNRFESLMTPVGGIRGDMRTIKERGELCKQICVQTDIFIF